MACGSRKGISPVLATLILIVIAVVAGLVVYGWLMGWIGTQKQQVAFAVRVIRTSAYNYTVEIRNVGSITVTLNKVTVTDPDGDTHEASLTGTLAPGHSTTATTKITSTGTDGNDAEATGTEVTVTVVCDKGSFTYKVTVE